MRHFIIWFYHCNPPIFLEKNLYLDVIVVTIIIIIVETIVDNPQKNEVLLMIATYSFDSFDLNINLFGNSVP